MDYSKLVDTDFGIIKEINDYTISNIGLFRYVAVRNNVKSVYNFQCCENYGYGYSFCKEDSIQSCIGEAVERYCSSFIPNDLLYISESMLKIPFLSNNSFIQSNKYPYVNQNQIIAWAKGNKLCDNSIIYIPASVVYMPYPKSKYFRDLRSCNTTGIAAGKTKEFAMKNALLELLERSFFVEVWTRKMKGEYIDINDLSEKNIKIIRKIEKNGYKLIMKKYRFSYISLPFYFLCIIGQDNSKYFAIKTGFSTNEVIFKLLGECVGGYFSMKEKETLGSEAIITEFEKNAFEFSDDQMEKYSFLLDVSNVEKATIEYEKIDSYSNLIQEVLNLDHDIAFADLTTEDIRFCGYYVIRVISSYFNFIESDFKKYKSRLIKEKEIQIINDRKHPFA